MEKTLENKTKSVPLGELINLEGNVGRLNTINFHTSYPVQELEFKGEIVLYRQAEDKRGSYAIVPGFKASKEYKTEFECSAVKIKRISNEKEKREISDLIRDKVKGPINFWPVEV